MATLSGLEIEPLSVADAVVIFVAADVVTVGWVGANVVNVISAPYVVPAAVVTNVRYV